MQVEKQYGMTQVCEFRLTQVEVDRIVKENVAFRCDPSYDFDTQNPLLLRDGDVYIVRFVQKTVTKDGSARIERLMPIKTRK